MTIDPHDLADCPLVFKYVVRDRLDVLRDSRIRFTQPDALNDPFEATPNTALYQNRLIESVRQGKDDPTIPGFVKEAAFRVGEGVATNLMEDMSKILGNALAFLSLSRVCDNLLMWSHYADSHTGFVIGFSETHDFFKAGRLSIHGLREVRYSRDRLVFPEYGMSGLSNEQFREVNDSVIFTKSVDWAYERELRLLAQPRFADHTIRVEGQPPIHLFNIPEDLIKAVIFGCRISPSDRDAIVEIVKDMCPRVNLFQAQISCDQFAVDIVPYDASFVREERMRSRIRGAFPWVVKTSTATGVPILTDAVDD